jgi:hypothetical protein
LAFPKAARRHATEAVSEKSRHNGKNGLSLMLKIAHNGKNGLCAHAENRAQRQERPVRSC